MTPLQTLYQNVQSGVWTAHIIVGIVSTIILGLYAASKTRSCFGSAFGLFAIVLHLIAGSYISKTSALDAVTNGVEAAKNENKTFVQKLHGDFTGYGEDISTCSDPVYEPLGLLASVESGREKTNCYYVRLVESGDDDYYWTAMFTQERRPWGWLNIYKDQKVYFTDHNIAMKDWENYKAGLFGVNGPGFGEKFEYEDPAAWTDLINRLEAGEVVHGSKTNLYFNYLLPTDTILKDDWSSKLPMYEGNLPVINPIYDVYKYDFIQWGKGITLDSATKANWQQYGSNWGNNAGPTLEGSTLVYFDLASQIDDPDNKIKASKAALMQDIYGKESLPKNLVIVECGVSDDYTTIVWCRFQQGMFVGNNELAGEIAAVSNVPFTPESFFGNISATSTKVENPTPDHRFDVVYTYDQSGVMGLVFRLFKRVEMADFDYQDTLIKPTPQQMEDIASNAIANAWKQIGTIYLLLLGALAKSNKKS